MQNIFDYLREPLFLRLWPWLAWVALECLVAIWAGVSRRHWFVRALAVWAAVALLAPIEAHDAVWFFTAVALLIVGLLQAGRWRVSRNGDADPDSAPGEPPGRYRFHLRDVFLLMLAAGLWLIVLVPAAREYQPENWLGFLTWTAGIAAIAVLAHLSVEGRRRWLWRGLLICALPLTIVAVIATESYTGLPGNPDAFRGSDDKTLVATQLAALCASWIVGLLLAVFLWHKAIAAPSRRRRLMYGGILALGFCAALYPSGYMYSRLLARAPAVSKFEASPNHYRRIVEIAERVERLNPSRVSLGDLRVAAPNAASADELASLYAELLPLLEAPNAVDYDPARDAHEGRLERYPDNINRLRGLVISLHAESESALAAGQYETAASYAAANIRIGAMLRRGGLLLHLLMGVSFQWMGQYELARIRHKLSPEQLRILIAVLERSMAEQEEVEQILARDAHYEDQVHGWRLRLESTFDQLLAGESWQAYVHETVKHSNATNTLLQTDMAIRLFRLDTGRLPAELSDLTPDFLPIAPIDPFANQPLRYRPAGDDFLLYSVGWDGRDDGGAFTGAESYHAAKDAGELGFDLRLDGGDP